MFQISCFRTVQTLLGSHMPCPQSSWNDSSSGLKEILSSCISIPPRPSRWSVAIFSQFQHLLWPWQLSIHLSREYSRRPRNTEHVIKNSGITDYADFVLSPWAATPSLCTSHHALLLEALWLPFGLFCVGSFLKYLFVYLAALGLSCGLWDLVPEQGWNPGPLHWEHRVLTTAPPGKSLVFF